MLITAAAKERCRVLEEQAAIQASIAQHAYNEAIIDGLVAQIRKRKAFEIERLETIHSAQTRLCQPSREAANADLPDLPIPQEKTPISPPVITHIHLRFLPTNNNTAQPPGGPSFSP